MRQQIVISAKALGRRKPLLADWSVQLPPEWFRGDGSFTLRQLIERIVRHEVAAFQQRQRKNELVRVLTAEEIEQGARKGKIDSGGRSLGQQVDPDEAVAVALEAFEDGLYLVIIDGKQYTDLDAQVFLQPSSQLTFLKLTMLAGA